MTDAFVIMQIGNDELDNLYTSVIALAIQTCGLEPKRVDRHNQGGLLKSEIISFLQQSEIIIADLTNERPNCYLEIGYAMGIDKFKNLILTVREEDTHQGLASERYRKWRIP
jgi:nucleoside 2-deoxyribosyltransferase